jgi:hypothetical protein
MTWKMGASLYPRHGDGPLNLPSAAEQADNELQAKCRARNIEIFYLRGEELKRFKGAEADWPEEEGWYWWSCSPGCLPDGEAAGPYKTKREVCEAALVDNNV